MTTPMVTRFYKQPISNAERRQLRASLAAALRAAAEARREAKDAFGSMVSAHICEATAQRQLAATKAAKEAQAALLREKGAKLTSTRLTLRDTTRQLQSAKQQTRSLEEQSAELIELGEEHEGLIGHLDAQKTALETEVKRAQRAERAAEERGERERTRLRCSVKDLERDLSASQAHAAKLSADLQDMRTKVAKYERLGRAEAAARIDFLEKQLNEAGKELRCLKQQANYSSKQSEANKDREKAMRSREFNVTRREQAAHTFADEEVEAQHAAELAAVREELARSAVAQVALIAMLAAADAELEAVQRIARPRAEDFWDGNHYSLKVLITCAILLQYNIAVANVQNVILAVAWLFSLDLADLQYERTVRATAKKERHTVQRVRLPGQTTIATHVPPVMQALSTMQVARILHAHGNDVVAAGGDRVFDSHVALMQDNGKVKGVDWCAVVLQAAVDRCYLAGFTPCLRGRAMDKAAKVQETHKRIRAAALIELKFGTNAGYTEQTARESTSMNTEAVAVTDREQAQINGMTGEDMREARISDMAEILAERYMEAGTIVCARTLPADSTGSRAEVELRIVDMLVDEQREDAAKYLAAYPLGNALSAAMTDVFTKKPADPLTAIATCVRGFHAQPSAVPSRQRAPRPTDLGAESNWAFPEAVDLYRAEHGIEMALSRAVSRAQQNSSMEPLLYIAAELEAAAAAVAAARSPSAETGSTSAQADRANHDSSRESAEPPRAPPSASTPEPSAQGAPGAGASAPSSPPSYMRIPEIIATFGMFVMLGMSAHLVTFTTCLMWLNCHEHALVNVFQAMMKVVNRVGKEAMGETLNMAAAVLTATQIGDTFSEVFHTGTWLMKDPITHFIFKVSQFFAPSQNDDLQNGNLFVQWCLANLEVRPWERWVLEGMMRICGSRNGVFWANSVAIFLFWGRLHAFLVHRQEVQQATSGNSGGKLRDYLIQRFSCSVTYTVVGVLAMAWLTIYLPMIDRITHVEHVKELGPVDQHLVKELLGIAEDPREFLEGKLRLFPERSVDADKIKRVADGLAGVRVEEDKSKYVPGIDADLARKLSTEMCSAGAQSAHHHTLEHQPAPFGGPDHPERKKLDNEYKARGGKLLNLPEHVLKRLENAPATSHAAERPHGIHRMLVQFKGMLSDDHMRAMTEFIYNKTGLYWREQCNSATPDEWRRVEKAVFELAAINRKSAGTRKSQLRHRGEDYMRHSTEVVEAARALLQRQQLEKERLRSIMTEDEEQILKMNVKQLDEQLRAQRVVAGKTGREREDVQARAQAGGETAVAQPSPEDDPKKKLGKLKLLFRILGIVVDMDRLCDAAKAARPVVRAKKRGRGDMWDIERIVSFFIADFAAWYEVQYRGFGPEYNELKRLHDLAGCDEEVILINSVPHEEMHMVLACHANTAELKTCPLMAGDRVLKDVAADDEANDYVLATVISHDTSLGQATVQFDDGRRSQQTVPREDLFKAERHDIRHGDFVVSYYKDETGQSETGWYAAYGYANIPTGTPRESLFVDFDDGYVGQSVLPTNVRIVQRLTEWEAREGQGREHASGGTQARRGANASAAGGKQRRRRQSVTPASRDESSADVGPAEADADSADATVGSSSAPTASKRRRRE